MTDGTEKSNNLIKGLGCSTNWPRKGPGWEPFNFRMTFYKSNKLTHQKDLQQ